MKTVKAGTSAITQTEQWICTELEYVHHLIRFIFNEEAALTPGIRFQLDNLTESRGKMLRPRLVLLGARIALGEEYDYSSLDFPETEFSNTVLENIRGGLQDQIRKRKYRISKESEFEKWKIKVPFPGGLTNRIYLIAAAMEILHMATLVHDDVIDNSSTRRGRPSANAMSGNSRAVLLGDLLFTLCLSLVNESASAHTGRILSESLRLIVRGELLQTKDRENFRNHIHNPRKRRYLKVIAGKTAMLFGLSLVCGASECGAEERLLELLGRIGFFTGLSFQIKDDELDYLADETKTGKPPGQDIREGKITLPVIFALNNKDQKKNSLKQEMLSAIEDFRAGEEYKLQKITKMISGLGGFESARSIAGIYLKRASRHLKELESKITCPGCTFLVRKLFDLMESRKS